MGCGDSQEKKQDNNTRAVDTGAQEAAPAAAAGPRDLTGRKCRFQCHTGAWLDGSAGDKEQATVSDNGTVFTVIAAEGGKFALRSENGNYLSCFRAEEETENIKMRNELKGWEQFELIWDDGKVGFKSAHDTFVSVKKDGTTYSAPHMKGWEKFTVDVLPRVGAFKTHAGATYLTGATVGDDAEEADAKASAEPVKFTIVELDNGKVNLKMDDGNYLSCFKKKPEVRAMGHNKGWEQFELEWNGNEVAIKTAHGGYLSADRDGSDLRTAEHNKGWEKFTFEE